MLFMCTITLRKVTWLPALRTWLCQALNSKFLLGTGSTQNTSTCLYVHILYMYMYAKCSSTHMFVLGRVTHLGGVAVTEEEREAVVKSRLETQMVCTCIPMYISSAIFHALLHVKIYLLCFFRVMLNLQKLTQVGEPPASGKEQGGEQGKSPPTSRPLTRTSTTLGGVVTHPCSGLSKRPGGWWWR